MTTYDIDMKFLVIYIPKKLVYVANVFRFGVKLFANFATLRIKLCQNLGGRTAWKALA
jgi:small basic protein